MLSSGLTCAYATSLGIAEVSVGALIAVGTLCVVLTFLAYRLVHTRTVTIALTGCREGGEDQRRREEGGEEGRKGEG